MRIFEDALSEQILGHLNNTGEIPRKNLYTPFATYSYRYYAATVKRLIDDGFLEVYKYKRINHIKLSEKGAATIKSLNKEKSAERAPSKKPRNAKEKRRKALVNGVIGLCLANNICTEVNDKPLLSNLFKSPLDKTTEENFKEKLASGIFYSTSEIRTAHKEALEPTEIANWSRLIGVVLCQRNITYIYSVNNKLIKWLPSCEIRTVKTISAFFKQSVLISQSIDFYDTPSAIVCGQGMSMITKLVTGRTWGKLAEKTSEDKYRAKLARDHINAHNLSKVFSAAYYVPINRQGVDAFKLALILNEGKKESICDNWFSKVGTATRMTSLPLHQGLSSKGERVIYSPYMDLIELEYYKKQGEPCHVVVSTGTQEAIARIIGPYLLSVRSLTGEKLNHGKYDRYGAKITPVKKERESEKNHEEKSIM